jgi:probable DNA metabolism protein
MTDSTDHSVLSVMSVMSVPEYEISMTFLYDGTFEGLLCAYAAALAQGEADGAEFASAAAWQPGLLDEVFRVVADSATAEALLERVRREVSPQAVWRLMRGWCAEDATLERPMFEYIRLGFKFGGEVDRHLTEPAVHTVMQSARRVGQEIHRFHGLLRFRELADGTLYGPMAPDVNIAAAVALHFVARLRGERWLIHDTRRGLGVFWDGKRLELTEIDGGVLEPEAQAVGETECQRLWQCYFKAVAIPERLNPALQRRCLPRRYWENLVEKPGRSTQ